MYSEPERKQPRARPKLETDAASLVRPCELEATNCNLILISTLRLSQEAQGRGVPRKR